MKIAVLSDMHGNSLALDASSADIKTAGVDEYWVLGDIVALGPDPVGVLQRLSTLQNCCFIRGNTAILKAGINCGFKKRGAKDLVRSGHDQTI